MMVVLVVMVMVMMLLMLTAAVAATVAMAVVKCISIWMTFLWVCELSQDVFLYHIGSLICSGLIADAYPTRFGRKISLTIKI